MQCKRHGIFKFGCEVAKWGNSKLKLRDELAVELGKPNNFCNILENFWLRPVFKELMLRHSRTIAVGTNIDSDKIQSTWGRCDSCASSMKVARPGRHEVGIQCSAMPYQENNDFCICIVINITVQGISILAVDTMN
jgi:hypothetical protein